MNEIAIPTIAGPQRALAASYYTDPAIYARELPAIFYRTWQYACHASQVGKPGDYVCFEICGQRLFILHDRDGALRCFHNVCNHRGHELLEGSGNKSVIVCPYHAWTYGLDGKLRKAPNDRKVAGFDRRTICLTAARVETFCGFVFVNLDADARPMADWYPDVEAELRSFVPDIDRLRPVQQLDIDEPCNWKVTVENYSECYHCQLTHPTFSKGVVDPESYNILPQGHCLRHTTRTAASGAMTYAYDAAANPHAAEYSSWFLWPAFSFQVYPGNVLNTYAWRPESVGRTMVLRGWYGIDGVETEAVRKLAEQDRNTTVAEDLRIVTSVQRGLASMGYQPGPLVIDPDFGVNSEHSVAKLHEWLLEALAAGPAGHAT
jgi:phenylpropionate dioxygenase-like ring-hydroxylating dioxygenase large terminal subunit